MKRTRKVIDKVIDKYLWQNKLAEPPHTVHIVPMNISGEEIWIMLRKTFKLSENIKNHSIFPYDVDLSAYNMEMIENYFFYKFSLFK